MSTSASSTVIGDGPSTHIASGNLFYTQTILIPTTHSRNPPFSCSVFNAELAPAAQNPPTNNGSRTVMLRSTNPLNVLSFLCFFSYILLPLCRRNHEVQDGSGSGSGTSRDVEMRRLTAIPAEVASGLQFQSVFSVITRSMRNMLIVMLPMMLAQTQGSSSSSSGDVERGEIIAMPAESCNGQALSGGERTRGMDREHSILLNPQSLGLKVLGIWIVPTLIGAISYITQVVVANGHAKPKQKLLLHICSGVTVATCVPGVVLFIFCIIQWKKNPIRDLIIKWMIILGFGSAVVNIVGPVIAFGFFYW